jgi:hypothetical protein
LSHHPELLQVLLELLLLPCLCCCAYALDLHPVCVVLQVLRAGTKLLDHLQQTGQPDVLLAPTTHCSSHRPGLGVLSAST